MASAAYALVSTTRGAGEKKPRGELSIWPHGASGRPPKKSTKRRESRGGFCTKGERAKRRLECSAQRGSAKRRNEGAVPHKAAREKKPRAWLHTKERARKRDAVECSAQSGENRREGREGSAQRSAKKNRGHGSTQRGSAKKHRGRGLHTRESAKKHRGRGLHTRESAKEKPGASPHTKQPVKRRGERGGGLCDEKKEEGARPWVALLGQFAGRRTSRAAAAFRPQKSRLESRG
jgi:hypothetical protein